MLSEPRIGVIGLMGCDFRGLVDGFIEVNVLSELGYVYSELTGAVIGSALEAVGEDADGALREAGTTGPRVHVGDEASYGYSGPFC